MSHTRKNRARFELRKSGNEQSSRKARSAKPKKKGRSPVQKRGDTNRTVLPDTGDLAEIGNYETPRERRRNGPVTSDVGHGRKKVGGKSACRARTDSAA